MLAGVEEVLLLAAGAAAAGVLPPLEPVPDPEPELEPVPVPVPEPEPEPESESDEEVVDAAVAAPSAGALAAAGFFSRLSFL